MATITVIWAAPVGRTLKWHDGTLEPDGSGMAALLELAAASGEEVLACPEGPWVKVADWPTDPYAFIGACETLVEGIVPTIVSDSVLPPLGPGDLDGEFPTEATAGG